ncbi:uncharacterized protein TNCV_483621 [Trichonephila clavipes]|uniref:Uncharacterized protein n=1 Tax=Trichonephila clavipes TaxID=2585209 RepID=A0A8X6RBL1_TRICX|nr:uncharacterized protein TNCV_483621 [Trichonephila clavipes]
MRRPVRRQMGSRGYLSCTLWPTLRCRGEAGIEPALSIGWRCLSSVSPERHCCRASPADKGWQVYPLDPRPDAVGLYSGCTPGKRRGWFLRKDRHTASLVGLGGWRHVRTKLSLHFWIQRSCAQVMALYYPQLSIDQISNRTCFFFTEY